MSYIGTDDEIRAWDGSPENSIQKMLNPEERKKSKCLDTTKIQTVKELNNTDFSKYAYARVPSWIKYIINTTSIEEIGRICALSYKKGAKIMLSCTDGRVYYRKRNSCDKKEKSKKG